jgi:hypothetical protein
MELTRFDLRNQAVLERIANALERIATVLEKLAVTNLRFIAVPDEGDDEIN